MTSELVPWRGRNVPVIQAAEEISRYSLTDLFARMTQNWGNLQSVTGVTYTQGKKAAEPIANSFEGYVQGLFYRDGPVAAVEWKRVEVFSQAAMLFQKREDGQFNKLYDDPSLDLLRTPWLGGSTASLMARALLFADLGGNAYIVRVDDELVVLRPDWVEIILEARMMGSSQVGWRKVGYAYHEGGLGNGDPAYLTVDEVAHFAPDPDPLASYRGMSWLTPIVREVMADKLAMDHKQAFFENSASPNLAVSLPKELTAQQFKDFVDLMDSKHSGVQNAGKTLYTGGGADVTVIGANMQQMDFAAVQGKGETRIANAGRVPAVVVGFSEGMQGSSLNAGNYQAAKRSFADTTCQYLWAAWCPALSVLFPPPNVGDRLWYNPRAISYLNEDAKDVAEIQQTQASTMSSLITSGYKPDSAVAFVVSDDPTKLVHSGLTSVQLLPPGARDTDGDGSVDETAADDEAESDYQAQLQAARSWLDLADSIARARYNIRNPEGSVGGGRFRKLSAVIIQALEGWMNGEGENDPLESFEQPQLREAAKQLGLVKDRERVSKPELKKRLLAKATADVHAQKHGDAPDKPKETKPSTTVTASPGDWRLAPTHSDGEGADDRSTAVAELLNAGKIDAAEASDILTGKKPLPAKPKAAAKVAGVRAPKAKRPPADVVADLKASKTRDEAHAHLDGMTVADLKQVAKELDYPTAGTTKDQLKTRLVEHTVGFRLNSAAIRDGARPGSWSSDIGHAPSSPAVAKAKAARTPAGPNVKTKAGRNAYLADLIDEELAKDNPALDDTIGGIAASPREILTGMRDRLRAGDATTDFDHAYDFVHAHMSIRYGQGGGNKEADAIGKPITDAFNRIAEKYRELVPAKPMRPRRPEPTGHVPKPQAIPERAKVELSPAARSVLDSLSGQRRPPSREQAAEMVKGLTTPDLRAIGKDLSIPGAGSMSLVKLRKEIVEATVGRRLDSISIRGFDEFEAPMTPNAVVLSAGGFDAPKAQQLDLARIHAGAASDVEENAAKGASVKALNHRLQARLKALKIERVGDRDVEVENLIRDSYTRLRARPRPDGPYRGMLAPGGEYVSLADLRDDIGGKATRAELDAALARLYQGHSDGAYLAPEEAQKFLTPRDRAAQMRFGGGAVDSVSFDTPSPGQRDAPPTYVWHRPGGDVQLTQSAPGESLGGSRTSPTAKRLRDQADELERIADTYEPGSPPIREVERERMRKEVKDLRAAAKVYDDTLADRLDLEAFLAGDVPLNGQTGDPETDAAQRLAELADTIERLTAEGATADQLIEAARTHSAAGGLRPTARAGDVIPFDRSVHDSPSPKPSPGALVLVIRPGYVLQTPDGDVVVERPLVLPT